MAIDPDHTTFSTDRCVFGINAVSTIHLTKQQDGGYADFCLDLRPVKALLKAPGAHLIS